MKKVVFSLLIAGTSMIASAQDGNNICVWNAMNSYNTGGGPAELERGMKCSDEAAVNPVTIVKSKTWFYRGQLYALVAGDTVLQKQYLTSSLEGANAFIKLHELNDPKFKNWDEALPHMFALSVSLFNAGVTAYEAHNYLQAAKYFYIIKDINNIMAAHKGKLALKTSLAITNAALNFNNAGDSLNAWNAMEEVYKLEPDTVSHLRNLIIFAKKAGKNDRYNELIDEGIKKFPKDPVFLSEKINAFLATNDLSGALKYVNDLIVLDPKNDEAYVVRGLAYDKMGNKDSTLSSYQMALRINPNNVKANNNLGKIYVDEANEIVDVINKLGNTAAETKKYNEGLVKIKELYKQGFPYIEKAHELDPSDPSISRSYNLIKLKLGQ